jgi:CMP-N,N'-diacetyllegionaminic acid synthase
MNIKYTAVIPVRAGSRRLPNKNIASFGETNLLIEKIKQLKQVKEIENIVVTSDSDEMLEMAKNNKANIHKRDVAYCDEKTKTFGELVAHVAENVGGEHIIWATCTSPLVLPQIYSEAISKYENALANGFDSLMSVEPFKRYMWDDNGPINYELGIKHVPSQELKQLYFVTDGILIAPRIKMIEWQYFHGLNPYKYPLEKIHCVDIDDKLDLEVARAWKNLL